MNISKAKILKQLDRFAVKPELMIGRGSGS
jgi:hypothetical protein